MGEGLDGVDYDAATQTYLAVADPHFSSAISLNTTPFDRDAVLDDLDEYVARFDADELFVGGDVGEQGDLEAFTDLAVDAVRAVEGNHDTVSPDDIEETGELAYDEVLLWEDDGFRWAMRHRPSDFGLQSTADRSSVPYLEPFDVVLYGHSHLPYERVLEDGTLAVGMGSLMQNKQVTEELPERSCYVVDVFDDAEYDVGLRHIDFDSGEILEQAVYSYGEDGFEELYAERLEGNRHQWQSD